MKVRYVFTPAWWFVLFSAAVLFLAFIFVRFDVKEKLTPEIANLQYKLNIKKRTLNPASLTDELGIISGLQLKDTFTGREIFDQQLKNTSIDKNPISVTISGDPKVSSNSFLFNEKVISGFSLVVTKETTEIHIYLSPEVSSLTSYEYELSRNYVSALLIADAYYKQQFEKGESLNNQALRVLTSKLVIDAADKNDLPVVITKK